MPYTESVINEALRFGTIIPLPPHVVRSPVKIEGFNLPIGTIVFGNLYAILHDPKVWPDADHFNPEANFPTAVSNDEEREALARRMQSFIPFSVGKRVCLGETLALKSSSSFSSVSCSDSASSRALNIRCLQNASERTEL